MEEIKLPRGLGTQYLANQVTIRCFLYRIGTIETSQPWERLTLTKNSSPSELHTVVLDIPGSDDFLSSEMLVPSVRFQKRCCRSGNYNVSLRWLWYRAELKKTTFFLSFPGSYRILCWHLLVLGTPGKCTPGTPCLQYPSSLSLLSVIHILFMSSNLTLLSSPFILTVYSSHPFPHIPSIKLWKFVQCKLRICFQIMVFFLLLIT